MSSIWDQPIPPGADASAPHESPARLPDTPTTSPGSRIFGNANGPLLSSKGRGIENGVPMGEVAEAREQALDDQYRFRPAWRSRLAARTRAALGR